MNSETKTSSLSKKESIIVVLGVIVFFVGFALIARYAYVNITSYKRSPVLTEFVNKHLQSEIKEMRTNGIKTIWYTRHRDLFAISANDLAILCKNNSPRNILKLTLTETGVDYLYLGGLGDPVDYFKKEEFLTEVKQDISDCVKAIQKQVQQHEQWR